MTSFDRYSGWAILKGCLLALVVLVLLISLAALVKELDDVGKGRFMLLDAFVQVALQAPERALELAPISFLVGAILGLGSLAAGNELLVMRAAGMSPLRLAAAVLKTALPLMVLTLLASEFSVPSLSQQAIRRKRIAISGATASLTRKALWFRDAHAIVRVGRVRHGVLPEDLQIFEFDSKGSLRSVLQARSASIQEGGHWLLRDVRRDSFGADASSANFAQLPWRTTMKARQLGLALIPPEALSLSDLWHALGDSQAGAHDQGELARAFWHKLGIPFLSAAMLLLALPFALGHAGELSRGRRLILGAAVGVLAYVLVQVIEYGGLLLAVHPALVALAPAAAAAGTAWFMLQNIR